MAATRALLQSLESRIVVETHISRSISGSQPYIDLPMNR
jgi:hypothetical protein